VLPFQVLPFQVLLFQMLLLYQPHPPAFYQGITKGDIGKTALIK